MTRVLAVVPYPADRAPGQRYRIEQWAPLLSRDGVEVRFSSFLSRRGMDLLYERGHVGAKVHEVLRGYLRRLVEVAQRCLADVIFMYREAAMLGPPWIESLLALRRPLVFDFDDAIYLPDTSQANAWARRLKPAAKVERICGMARHVTVGNDVLARFARNYAREVTVIPSTIDTDVYQVRERTKNSVPVIGWTGSVTTVRYLTALTPMLRRLRAKWNFELVIIGTTIRLEGLSVRCLPWRAASEPEDLRRLDIGLMPLPDDEWSRGKCGMKALQYMALGIPPVVSPVGANATIVQDGINGFHAKTEEEWIERIGLLLEDEGLRRTIGTEARRTIERSYSARVQAPRVARIFKEIAA